MTVTVQLALAANVAPLRLSVEAPAVAVSVPLGQVVDAPFGVATIRPEGRLSVKASAVALGFKPDHVLTVRVQLPRRAYASFDARVQFVTSVLERPD